ncbi:MmgE/PrpD family protein [Lichenibacterium minor]|uniref:MmgE/PrpD family protein n=1 Tax=Lichenibacterium minor TaxID=2316528 RepID=A0A4Q2U5T7_9HYPH|nr:MmgE/PrpD family protein [Lichenibacterium minor]RYC30186.1 MmgE/PrpD family protein [Lichenibacterium minor]
MRLHRMGGLDRRSFLATSLATAGSAMALGALPGRACAAPVPVGPVMATLSAYMAAAGGRALPDEVTEKAKQHVLDTFAAMISGSSLPPALAALKFARGYATDTTATIAASRLTANPLEAALVNGMLAHSDETDDSNEFSQSHPGCAVVPAALAAGEKFDADGTRFLRAVALGYDIGPRVTISFGAVEFRDESHKATHAIAGGFAAAAAAGSLAGLDAQRMRWLLDYSAQQSSGIGAWARDTSHVEKSFVFAGMPARNGVTSALAVQSGFTGVDDIFSGPDNYFEATAPNAKPELLIEGLGQRYEIARTNIKKWTVGSPIQAPLDAMAAIFAKRRVAPDDVRSVVVQLAHTEARTVNDRDMPDISLQHMVAVMLLDGTASFAAAHDRARMADPAVLRQRAKVKLVESPELERLEPARQAIVDITLNDGTVLSERVTAVRGTVDNPMPRDEIVAKARDLCEPVIGKAQTASLIAMVLGLDGLRSVRDLRGVLQTA